MSVKIVKNGLMGLMFLALMVVVQTGYASQDTPQDISADAVCGKCGMHPAKFPNWQTQIVFKDGSMTPFDGCKCMFGFLFDMGKYDETHKADDVAAIYVRDFQNNNWVNGKNATYVVGSKEMGPMGKELIPFSDQTAAEAFQKENGGTINKFEEVNMDTLKPLMGEMKMKGEMKM